MFKFAYRMQQTGMFKFLRLVRDWLLAPIYKKQDTLHDYLVRTQWTQSLSATKNPLSRFGAKYFSQTDEDGITLEIVKRLGVTKGTFVELGVGDGLENNTLILLAMGWRGFWIGGEDLCFNHKLNPQRFAFLKAFVTLENVTPLMQQGFEKLAISATDVLSVDLDGNDYYFVKELLESGISPKLFIVEYNAKFPPPIKWTIAYDANHLWDHSDYSGASLELLSGLLASFSYTLLCCNAATGANAFFVRDEYLSYFPEAPKNIDDIFVPANYQLFKQGHRPSPKTIERMLIMGASSCGGATPVIAEKQARQYVD
ncbi:hypothetical protein IY145_24155 [Methylosinus sp. H3A]|uniref:hypothetical protein n=1 Tax=Methylosinus sp. H3A TaxID=2785786 RepID=UPI0018C2700E|nr:hypothetical protein [Methylosinus sp. H3A]MBG0812433.1 hypothetical protein [Methylosinus sp. H3A]